MDINKIIAEVTEKVLAEVEGQKAAEAQYSLRPDEVDPNAGGVLR